MLFLILSTVAAGWVRGQAVSKKAMPNPDDTQKALTYLLTISDELIPPASSWKGSYGQAGQARVKDLLAMELSSLWGGRTRSSANAGSMVKHYALSLSLMTSGKPCHLHKSVST